MYGPRCVALSAYTVCPEMLKNPRACRFLPKMHTGTYSIMHAQADVPPTGLARAMRRTGGRCTSQSS